MAPRWPKMRLGAHLGLHLDGYWGASWRQDNAKLANLAPRCAQDGQLGGQNRQLGALLGASWRPFLDLGRDLTKNCENQKKRRQFITFEGFLGSWGCSWRLCWLILALCWAMLGHLGAISEHKMGRKSAKMCQDSAQERQDETRWRKWAPEGGSRKGATHASSSN